MTDESKDPLARWWWPGQWLRIVWGVWVDQVWYWQTVRPRLHGRKQGWGLFLQSLLGATIVTVLFLLPIVGLLVATGSAIGWQAFLGLVVSFVLGVGFSIVSSLIGGLDKGVPINSALIPSFVIIRFVWDQYSNEVPGNWVGFLLFYMVISLGGGILSGILMGISQGRIGLGDTIVFSAAFALIVATRYVEEPESIIQATIKVITVFLFSGFWIYLGGRWATRQILDDETRKRLAKPDVNDTSSTAKSG